ncbi:MAG: M20 family metallopeptidase [Chloroflexi bacterium]|nr:M20 family metallopeptidase [Chloroflexota bacterium]MBI3341310.1 M20 family metallopeptidase [Chloroflexota bacterium]
MKNILAYLENHTTDILADLEILVRIESPSNDVEGINRLQHVTQSWLGEFGQINRHSSRLGDIVHAHIQGQSNERIVFLAHIDTVYPVGAWENLWRVTDGLAYGPGTYDMKGGVIQAIWALRAIKSLGLTPASNIDFLLTPDEESGSEIGRPYIEDIAKGAKAVLVLEPPFMNGDLKVARKGVGEYKFNIYGRAAHQGLEPQNGQNAIVSAAHLISELVKLQDWDKGTTLGPNVIQGGTVSNVVADHAALEVDLRVWSLEEAERADKALRAIQPLDGTRYEISGGLNRPPMEPSEGSLKLFDKARTIANEIGFDVGASRVGGGSDGNFTSHLAPTLDGFGAFGAGAHQKNIEHIHIASLVPRSALIAGMLIK